MLLFDRKLLTRSYNFVVGTRDVATTQLLSLLGRLEHIESLLLCEVLLLRFNHQGNVLNQLVNVGKLRLVTIIFDELSAAL